jgi:hypothetical protein
MNLDIIGDVHGQCDKLVSLLRHLDYSDSSGTWRHPERKAVFVGDLIDRGPRQVATVDLVRAMVEAGSAQCIMGNHEFNAVAWATPDPKRRSRFLRPHSQRSNRKQHHAFLKEVEGTHRHGQIIAWFKTLPLWLDLGGVRVVHACWHQESMDVLRPLLGPNQTLTDEVIERGNRKGDAVFEAIEVVCKGPEIRLPGGMSFQDGHGKIRHTVRARWWQDDLSTYRDAAMASHENEVLIPDVPLPPEWRGHSYSGPPVFFGHYWLTGVPAVRSNRFACLDYSVAKGGPLMAYRWDGESELSSQKMAWV